MPTEVEVLGPFTDEQSEAGQAEALVQGYVVSKWWRQDVKPSYIALHLTALRSPPQTSKDSRHSQLWDAYNYDHYHNKMLLPCVTVCL